MSASRETRQWQRLFCPHCEEKVSKSTYYRHRAEHYDLRTGAWRKSTDDPVVCDSLRESVAKFQDSSANDRDFSEDESNTHTEGDDTGCAGFNIGMYN